VRARTGSLPPKMTTSSVETQPPFRPCIRNVRDLIHHRQKGTSHVQIAKWALYEEREFEQLIDRVTGLVTSLIELSPAAQAAQTPLCKIEVSELAGRADEKAMALLRDTADGVDKVLGESISEADIWRRAAGGGHIVKDVRGIGGSKLLIGDEVAGGAKVRTGGHGHYVEGVTLSGSKAQIGDRYGYKSFWDE
jgi:hypothetical protein